MRENNLRKQQNNVAKRGMQCYSEGTKKRKTNQWRFHNKNENEINNNK